MREGAGAAFGVFEHPGVLRAPCSVPRPHCCQPSPCVLPSGDAGSLSRVDLDERMLWG